MVNGGPARRQAATRGSAAAIVGAAALWGTTGTAQALAPAAATPLVVGALRLLVGAAGLAVVARGRLTRVGGPLPLAVGAVAIAGYQVGFFFGVERAGVALGTVVGIGSAPLMTGLAEWALTRQAPSHRWFLATAVAVSGVAALLWPRGGAAAADPLGVVAALGAGAAYAAYTLAAKRVLDAGAAPRTAMATLFGLGALLSLPLLATGDLSWVAEPAGGIAVLWLGVGATALAYVLFGVGLAGLPAPTVATLSLTEPLTAALLGVIVLGELLSPLGVAGAMLLVAGLLIAARQSPGPASDAAEP